MYILAWHGFHLILYFIVRKNVDKGRRLENRNMPELANIIDFFDEALIDSEHPCDCNGRSQLWYEYIKKELNKYSIEHSH